MEESLIDKLEAAKHGYPNHPRGIGYDEGLEVAIAIVRQHQAVQPQDAVELLRDMRMQASYSHEVTMPVPLYERMKAVIAAMGESGQPGSGHGTPHLFSGESLDRNVQSAPVTNPAPANPSEISVNLLNRLDQLFCDIGQLLNVVNGEWKEANCWSEWDESVLQAMRAFHKEVYEAKLAAPEPVSVSLELSARAIAVALGEDESDWSHFKQEARAALDAAGVKYVD